jgi:peroxiredoxin
MLFCAQMIDFLAGDENPLAAEDQKILRNSIVELCESKISADSLKAGERAPVFTLESIEGDEVCSVDLLRKGPLIVMFLRGLWCRYSYTTLTALEAVNKAIIGRGVSIVAISPQIHLLNADMQRKKLISFPMLRDPYSRVAMEFQVTWRLSYLLKKKYRTLGADLDKLNGVDSEMLPMVSLFVIDKQGIIVYSEVNANYVQPINEEEFLLVLDNIPSLRKARGIE